MLLPRNPNFTLFMTRGIALCLISIGLLASCKNKKIEAPISKQSNPVPVDIVVASISPLPTASEFNGTVLSQESADLHSEVSGRIIYLNFPDGAAVSKGTLLLRINNSELLAQRKQAQVQKELSAKTVERLGKLLEIKGVNQADYDQAWSQLKSLESSLEVLEAQIAKTEIRAPFDGVLGLRQVSNGAYITPSQTIGTIHSKNKVKIDFVVPEHILPKIKKGSQVQVYTSENEKSLTAKVIAIDGQINLNTRNATVRAELSQFGLTAGSFVKIVLQEKKQGILVPTQAVIPDAVASQVVLVKNGKGMMSNIETGYRTADFVEVTKGINRGDSIVVTGVLFVRPKSQLTVRKVKSLDDFMNLNTNKE